MVGILRIMIFNQEKIKNKKALGWVTLNLGERSGDFLFLHKIYLY